MAETNHNKTVVCIGTGPSLSSRQIDKAREKGFHLYGCNHVYQIVPDLEVLYCVNTDFWAHYWTEEYEWQEYDHTGREVLTRYNTLKDHACKKWTTNLAAAHQYKVNYIPERMGIGLSTDYVIHHGHGSGFSLLSLAVKLGATRIILLGYDLSYASDYDGTAKHIGSSQRHYFGEYPGAMQHWPSKQVGPHTGGVHAELVGLYEAVWYQNEIFKAMGYRGLELINATPRTALTLWDRIPIEDIPE